MSIERVTSGTVYRPITALQQSERLSKTDWKTHSIVVLSYLLIAIGFGLACCAVYIALTVHPMIAMASPVVPIALGILGLQYAAGPNSKLFNFPLSPNVASNQPPGISNAGANCWINASLQFLFKVPAFRKKIEALSEQSESVLQKAQRAFSPSSGLFPLIDAFQAYKKAEHDKLATSEVDSQKVRAWLHGQKVKIELNHDIPDDPTEFFLNPVLKKIRHGLPMEVGKEITRKGTEIVSINSQRDSSYYFDLTGALLAGKYNLTEAFNYHFNHDEALPSGEVRQTIGYLEKAPEDFCVSVPAGAESGKVIHKVDGAMEVALTAAQVGEDAQYFCDGFISHEGRSIENGHYVAYLYQEGNWWKASDSHVHKISLKEANNELAKASFMHYQKASTATQIT